MHTHTCAPPPTPCEDLDTWPTVASPLKVSWCGASQKGLFNQKSGELFLRGIYHCGHILCPRCSGELVALFLSNLDGVFAKCPRIYWTTPRISSPWKTAWLSAVGAARKAGTEIDYMVVKRQSPITRTKAIWLWASTTGAFRTSGGWESCPPDVAVGLVRDQLCLPGPMPGSFPPKRSLGWAFQRKQTGGFSASQWKYFAVDQDAYETTFFRQANLYAIRNGVKPGEGVELPDPDGWFRQLHAAGILIGGA